MKTVSVFSLCAALAFSSAVFAEEKPAEAQGNGSDSVLTIVNGEPITQAEFDDYSRVRSKMGDVVPDPETMMEELVRRELLYQAAIKEGLDKNADILHKLETFRYNLLAETMQIAHLDKHPIAEEQLQTEYDNILKNAKRPSEYKVRHILVETEEKAKEIIEKLNKGGDFAELAKAESMDTYSKENGGAFDWFPLEQMVEPFANAIKDMQKDDITPEPVKTRYGFHVIQFLERREAEAPKFEAVREELTTRLQNQMLVDYMTQLKADAKIEVKKSLRIFDKNSVDGK